ncbi:unnamed protein product [Pleuronectes platessa]|uniref:Uncharacterized protein n=1 Tax=Pleuronectes platessa TaxID=8262 RepID=A0A9N7YT50_PLEPL|nr:unnamed protein product [Pleuronectes platessa]
MLKLCAGHPEAEPASSLGGAVFSLGVTDKAVQRSTGSTGDIISAARRFSVASVSVEFGLHSAEMFVQDVLASCVVPLDSETGSAAEAHRVSGQEGSVDGLGVQTSAPVTVRCRCLQSHKDGAACDCSSPLQHPDILPHCKKWPL